jgi:hypothetical protein
VDDGRVTVSSLLNNGQNNNWKLPI